MIIKRCFLKIFLSFLDIIPPKTLLRTLFRIDQWMYYIQGHAAVRYGKGIHPKHRLIRYHDFFVHRINSGENVLDIGCGNGAVAFDIAQRTGAMILGIDIKPGNIAIAEQKYHHPNIRYWCGDITKEVPDGNFEVILLSNVLEHLEGRPGLLRKLQSEIRPDRFLIRVPLFERDWRVPLKKELGLEWRLDPTHQTEYTLESFAEEINQAGLLTDYQEIRWGEIWAEVRSKS